MTNLVKIKDLFPDRLERSEGSFLHLSTPKKTEFSKTQSQLSHTLFKMISLHGMLRRSI